MQSRCCKPRWQRAVGATSSARCAHSSARPRQGAGACLPNAFLPLRNDSTHQLQPAVIGCGTVTAPAAHLGALCARSHARSCIASNFAACVSSSTPRRRLGTQVLAPGMWPGAAQALHNTHAKSAPPSSSHWQTQAYLHQLLCKSPSARSKVRRRSGLGAKTAQIGLRGGRQPRIRHQKAYVSASSRQRHRTPLVGIHAQLPQLHAAIPLRATPSHMCRRP